jgi:hypothetical protein
MAAADLPRESLLLFSASVERDVEDVDVAEEENRIPRARLL